MAQSALLNASILKKVAMALSGIFLITFLALHVSLNFISIISKDVFNEASHFMGYNPLIQYVMQPVLAIGVIFHFVMGFVLTAQNSAARPIAYAKYNGAANASWTSRNMIISGLVILAFLGLHFYDFWFPEVNYKYIVGEAPNATRYYDELVHKFHDPIRTGLYCVAFVLLGFHLWHGFSSSLQSVGMHNKYSRFLSKVGYGFAVVVPALFIIIALVHHFNN
ncbi:succinate dehydrogenase cytochrome b subunit [Flavobacterium sp. MC2016-06]|jgi:succinate dehydrogenase / fumarate reductase cytochrome b subunit|uniref:succinate dehydrogenase cytochrome b subunit n=1 Tax=Flavobacterium sp. MC2016-06 TaxID=2676308 RepID=UPI0012BB08DC|nr:succinate dehydrogenase cytochrome b subunit [Flavobacterium sp. MC2016-06]MBU3860870.1 succinate dehydrogenase cytochrome b subunit [Flavobacterium sp. MC2016-06]